MSSIPTLAQGIKLRDLQCVLRFMYNREVEVEEEELNTFLAVADELAVKGLATENLDRSAKTGEKKKTNDKRATRTVNDRDGVREKSQENTRDQTRGDTLQGKTQDQTRDLERGPIQQGQICNEELDDEQLENGEGGSRGSEGSSNVKGNPGEKTGNGDISKTLKKELHGYSCNLCGKQCSDLSKAKSHIEAKHFPSSTGYICNCCHQWFKTKNALSIHMSREHRNKH